MGGVCRGGGQVSLRGAGWPQTRHLPPAPTPPFSTPNHATCPISRPVPKPTYPQKVCAPGSAFPLDWSAFCTLCTYKSRPPTFFALPPLSSFTPHIELRFSSSHPIPQPPFVVHHQTSQPRATTHHRPQSFCSHRHFYPPPPPISTSTINTTTMDMVQPPDTPTSRMQEIVDHLEYGRVRVASVRLLADRKSTRLNSSHWE